MLNLLVCSKCKISFETYERAPMIFPSCSHTVCNACATLSSPKVECPLCTASKIKALGPNSLKPIQNNLILNIVELSNKHPRVNNLALIAQNYIKAINTECILHKKPVKGFDTTTMQFFCKNCKVSENMTISIESIISTKLTFLEGEKNYQERLFAKFESFKIDRYDRMVEYFEKSQLITNIKERLRSVSTSRKPSLIKTQLMLTKIFQNFNPKLQSILKTYNKISDSFDLWKEQYRFNLAQLRGIIDGKYDLQVALCKQVLFKNTERLSDIRILLDKLERRKNYTDNKINIMLNRCSEELTEHKFFSSNKPELESWLSQEYNKIYNNTN